MSRIRNQIDSPKNWTTGLWHNLHGKINDNLVKNKTINSLASFSVYSSCDILDYYVAECISPIYIHKKKYLIFSDGSRLLNEYYIFSFGITSVLHIVIRIFIHTSDGITSKTQTLTIAQYSIKEYYISLCVNIVFEFIFRPTITSHFHLKCAQGFVLLKFICSAPSTLRVCVCKVFINSFICDFETASI